MLVFGELFKRIQNYRLRERTKPEPGALEDIEARISALPMESERRAAHESLEDLRACLLRMDLSGCAWPPQSASPDEDMLYADTQKLVSAVVRVVHSAREVRILKFVLKVKP